MIRCDMFRCANTEIHDARSIDAHVVATSGHLLCRCECVKTTCCLCVLADSSCNISFSIRMPKKFAVDQFECSFGRGVRQSIYYMKYCLQSFTGTNSLGLLILRSQSIELLFIIVSHWGLLMDSYLFHGHIVLRVAHHSVCQGVHYIIISMLGSASVTGLHEPGKNGRVTHDSAMTEIALLSCGPFITVFS